MASTADIDASLSDLGGSLEAPLSEEELSALWRSGPTASGLSARETRKIMSVCLSSHIAITRLCRENYGDKFKDWPEHAQRIPNTLSMWGCSP
jgi:hypothetical protein